MAQNEYLKKAIRLQEQDRFRRQALTQPDINPEQQAGAIRVSDEQGIPVDVARRNLEQVDTPTVEMPEPTVQRLMDDPDMAAAIKDDTHSLNFLERQVRGVSQSWTTGRNNVELSKIGFDQMFGEVDEDRLLRGKLLDEQNAGVEDYDFSYVGGVPSATAEQLPIWGQIVTGAADDTVIAASFGFAGSLGNPAGALVGAGIGFKVGSAWEAFKLESGLAYREYMAMEPSRDINSRQGEMDSDTARGAAVAVGMVNAGLEATSLNYLLRSVPGADKLMEVMTRESVKKLMKIPTASAAFKKFGKTVAGGMATEGLTEGLQELMTTLGGIYAANAAEGDFDIPTASEVLSRVTESAIKGSQGGAGFSTATGGVNLGVDLANVRRANQRAAMFQEMGKAATESKTRERLPARFQQFIKDVQDKYGSVTDVYVNPEVLKTYFQQLPEEMPETRRRMEEAELTGQDVAIPMDEFIAFIAPSDTFGELVPDLKFSPDELSQREAQDLQAEIDATYSEMANREDRAGQEADPVFEDMKAQLEAAGQSSVVAEQQAQVWSSLFRIQAKNTGRDAWELYKSFNPSTRNEDLRAQERQGVSRLDNMLDMLRAGKVPSQREIFGDTFGEAIAKAGGLRDEGGELKARDFDRRVSDRGGETFFANRKISKEDGMSFDDAISFGIENGYLPESAWEDMTGTEILDLLDKEISGEPLHRDTADQDALALRDDLEYLGEMLDKLGISLDDMANEEVKKFLNEGSLYQVIDDRNELGLYSEALRVARTMSLPEWKDDGAAKGKVIWQKLDKSGIRKEELEWLGIENWLASERGGMSFGVAWMKLYGSKPVEQATDKELKKARKLKGKFTREDVVRFIESNGVVVEETIADQEGGEGTLDWMMEQVWDDSEAWQGDAEYWADEWKSGENDLGIDLDSTYIGDFHRFMAWYADEINEIANNIQDTTESKNFLDRIEQATRDYDTDIKYLLQDYGADMEDAIREWIVGDNFEIVEEAADEYAREIYYENPIYIQQSVELNDGTVYFIFGNDDQGYDIRINGFTWGDSIGGAHSDIYSLEEAQITAAEHAASEGSIAATDEEATRWGQSQYITPPGVEIGHEEDYREFKLKLPELEGDFYEEAHFPDRNIVAFLRTTFREGRMFFIDEMQSDWHQAGRQSGYKTGRLSVTEEIQKLNEIKDEVLDIFWHAVPEQQRLKWDDQEQFDFKQAMWSLVHYSENRTLNWEELPGRLRNAGAHLVEDIEARVPESVWEKHDEYEALAKKVDVERFGEPNAPFKGDNWMALALKRALVKAAEEGKKKFGWADAAVLSDRWSSRYRELYTTQYDKKMPGIVKRLTGIEPEHRTLNGEPYPEDGLRVLNREEAVRYLDSEGFRLNYRYEGVTYTVQAGSVTHLNNFQNDSPTIDENTEFFVPFDDEQLGYWSIPITDELRERITSEGFTLFQKERIEGVRQDSESAIEKTYKVNSLARKINDRVWYRGQHGKSDQVESTRASPTFTDNKAIAEVYARSPNDSRMTAVAPKMIEINARVKNPALLGDALDSDDPFVDFDKVAELVGFNKAKEIFNEEAGHIYNTNNWHELGLDSIDDMADEDYSKLYVDFYPIADNELLQDALRQAGYDAIVGTGATGGETATELRLLSGENDIYSNMEYLSGYEISEPEGTGPRSGEQGDLFDVLATSDLPGQTRREVAAASSRILVKNETVNTIQASLPGVSITEPTSEADELTAASEIARIASGLARKAQEQLLLITTDKDGKVVEILRHSIGTIDSAVADPGFMAGSAMDNDAATNMWMIHNHPSGLSEQSEADRRIAGAVRDLTRGSSLNFRGSVVVPATGDQASFYRLGLDGVGSIDIPLADDGDGSFSFPVTEREIERMAPGEITISDPISARQVAQDAPPGIIILDNQHQVIAHYPMSYEEMGNLRESGQLREVLRLIHQVNGAAMVIKVDAGKDMDAPMNLARMLNNSGRRTLDIFAGSDSAALEGRLDLSERGGTFKQDDSRGYIQFNDARDWFRITLTEKANLSTFLHESGHAFLEMLNRIQSESPLAARDMKIIREYLGAEAEGNFTTEQHERFARSFEAYLMEGRAPSLKLAGAFERFRSWLKAIYKSFQKLDVELTDEVRGVFDRMLATEEEIAEAKQASGFMPLIQGVDTELMSPDEYAAYMRLHGRATREAEDELEKQLLNEVSGEARKQLAEERARVRELVKAEVEAMPAYRADRDLRTGSEKLSGAALRAMYIDVPKGLSFLWSKDGGVHPDDIAGEYGYGSGDELVQAILTKPKKQELIDKLVDERVKPADSIADGSVTEKALQAIHGDPAAMFLHAELKALGKKIGQTSSLGVIKQAARERIASRRIMDLKPGEYRAAEKRASKDAVIALREKNYAAAHDAKRRQLLNHYLYIESSKAKAEASDIFSYLKKFESRKTRERLGKTDYLDAIDTLLEGVELKQKTLREIGRRKSLREFIDSAHQRDEAIVIPGTLAVESELTNYKQMTMDDFRALRDAIANIDHISRLKNKLQIRNQERDFEATIVELLDNIYENNEVRKPSEYQNPTMLERAKSWVATAHAHMTKIEFITRWIDNSTAGFAHQVIFQPFVDAQAAKYDMSKQMNEMIRDIFDSRTKEQVVRHKARFNFMGKNLRGDEIIAVALNMGNTGNLMKLATGYGWNPGQMKEELDRWMTREDWDLVQSLWDSIDTLWPEIEAVNKRVTGLAPVRVQATPVETPFGTYRGGYYPVVYDTTKTNRRSLDQRRHQEAKAAKGLFENNFMRPDVDRGFTQSRSGYSAPILLSLDVIPAHVHEVIHFITHYEAVIQVLKITDNKDFRIAIEETMGPEIAAQFRPWLQAVANDANVHPDIHFIDKILKHFRSGITVVAMGYKLSTATMQFFGLFTTIDEVGLKGTYSGLKQLIAHPKQTWDFVNESSGEMRHILTTFDRDVRKTVDQLFGKSGKLDVVQQYAFHIMGYAQKTVNMITWKGAYDQAIDAGESHERAVNKADAAVRQSQSAGGVKDLAAVQRGNAALQTFTMFYTYFSVLYNRLTDVGRGVKEGNPAEIARLSWLILLPVFFETMLRNKEPEDEEEWLQWYAVQSMFYGLTTVPFLRDVASGAFGDYGYNMTPVTKFGESVSRAYKGMVDEDEMTEGELKAAVDALGITFKLPTGQAWALGEYLAKLDEVEDPLRELIVGLDHDK